MTHSDFPASISPYEAAELEAQKRIRERWRYLLRRTRALLTASGFYSEHGERLATNAHSVRVPEHDIERLERALGVLAICARAKLPDRSAKGAPIPAEALDREVPTECLELLFVPGWRDPEFLRVALSAICQHETADALTTIGPAKSSNVALGCLGVLASWALLLISPAMLAAALASATKGDTAGASAALYVVGLAVLAAVWLKKKDAGGDETPLPERRYLAWTKFRYSQGNATIGEGAHRYFAQMQDKGVPVPAVAFEVCEALKASALAAAAADTA